MIRRGGQGELTDASGWLRKMNGLREANATACRRVPQISEWAKWRWSRTERRCSQMESVLLADQFKVRAADFGFPGCAEGLVDVPAEAFVLRTPDRAGVDRPKAKF